MYEDRITLSFYRPEASLMDAASLIGNAGRSCRLAWAACKADEWACKGRSRSFYPLQACSSDLSCAAARQAAWQFQGRDVAAKTERFRTGKRNTRLGKAGRGGRFFSGKPAGFPPLFLPGRGQGEGDPERIGRGWEWYTKKRTCVRMNFLL